MNTSDYFNYPTRTCRSLHECGICGLKIVLGDQYFDGGYGRRAHLRCAEEKREAAKPVFTHCNVCGRELISQGEFAIGMCAVCANE